MSQNAALDSDDAAQLLDIASESVKSAIPRFIQGLDSAPAWRAKSERDPVSEIDIAIEHSIRSFLEQESPNIEFVGEETGGAVPSLGQAWGLDPIDGTVNYLQGSPLCAISLGLFVDGTPELGIVVAPALQLSYRGAVGIGATCNGRQIAPSSPPSIDMCVVSVGDYATGDHSNDKNVDRLSLHRWLAANAYRVRMLGSAALDLVWVADGRLGASVILSNRPWDMAGGAAIARAAGAAVRGKEGEAHRFDSRATLTSGSEPILEAVVEHLRSSG